VTLNLEYLHMTTKTPTIITIKLLAATAPNVKEVEASLAQFGSILQYEAVNLVFDGNALVPAPVAIAGSNQNDAAISPAPKANKEKARKVQAAQATKRAKDKQPAESKAINLEEGSNPERIFSLIRSGPALTSTQIREKLGLNSNVVNTTVYRLKHAGMIRPMSHNAPNGDTLYTSTEWDPKPAVEVTDDAE
jgi:hypothetical protein